MKSLFEYTEQTHDLLRQMSSIVSPTMREDSMRVFMREQLEALGLEVETDVMGNIHASAGSAEGPQIGLVAHLDTVALQISSILPNGMATCRHIGLKPHVALGQPVQVLTDKGMVDGVIGFDTTSQYGQPKGLVEEDLWLDLGVSSAEETKRLVDIGDLVVLTPRLQVLNDKYLCGTGLDDRVGLLVLLEAAKRLLQSGFQGGLHLYGTVQEEVGLRGANIAVSKHTLDACFVIDVDYATDMPASHANQMGHLALGHGAGVHVKADNNPALRALACQAAEAKGIPYQKSLGRFVYGGTDATAIQICGAGVATMNINIPCRYMHSPVEICHTDDIVSAVNLLVETIHAYPAAHHIAQ